MESNPEMPETSDPFGRTRWSLVQQAQAGSAKALEDLLQAYRVPVVRHLTRHLGPNDGEDAAQDYLAGLLASGYLGRASREHGKFRAFLLHDLRYFILGWKRKARAVKRGGGKTPISYEELIEEGMQFDESDSEVTTEQFDRDWTLGLMKKVRDDLADNYHSRGEGKRFQVLERFIELGGEADDFEKAAAELEMTANAVKVATTRMRQAYAQRLRSMVADSLGPDESVDDELDYLRQCYLAALRQD